MNALHVGTLETCLSDTQEDQLKSQQKGKIKCEQMG